MILNNLKKVGRTHFANLKIAMTPNLCSLRFYYLVNFSIVSFKLGNSFIKGANVGLVGRNLFFLYKEIDHVDPEASLGTGNNGQGILSYNLPSSRSIGFNVNIKF